MRNSERWNKLRNKILIIYPLYGTSLERWYKLGRISYEVILYNHLCKYLRKIYLVTYGNRKDLDFKYFLDRNFHLLLNISNLRPFIYSFIEPILHKNILKNAHIIKTYQIMGAWTALIAKMLYRKKLIVRQGYPLSIFQKEQHTQPIIRFLTIILEALAYHLADCIIVTSNSQRRYIIDHYHVNPKKITVIPNYLDTNTFKPLNNEGTKNGKIVFVGRLDEQKNLFSLLEALNNLPYSLTIIGSGHLKNALDNYAKERKIDVEFLGIIPNNELPNILNQHEIFILPSFYEGMPKTLLEAMACGLPVIGTDVDGIREVIEHEENGILCGTDVVSIRKAILKLMNDEMLKRKIRLNAIATIIDKFSFNKLIEKELVLYENLLSS